MFWDSDSNPWPTQRPSIRYLTLDTEEEAWRAVDRLKEQGYQIEGQSTNKIQLTTGKRTGPTWSLGALAIPVWLLSLFQERQNETAIIRFLEQSPLKDEEPIREPTIQLAQPKPVGRMAELVERYGERTAAKLYESEQRLKSR